MKNSIALTGLVALALALATAGCGGSDAEQAPGTAPDQSPAATSAPSSSPTPTDAEGLTLTSSDFVNQGELPASAYANAFEGQCEGENLSPQLTWTGAPESTESFAIIMIDLTAGNFLHWSHADIPATVTSVDAGGAASLAGVAGNLAVAEGSYFGPCPPDPDHQYVFTVYALDTTLGLGPDYPVTDLRNALATHTLAEASIVGVASPLG